MKREDSRIIELIICIFIVSLMLVWARNAWSYEVVEGKASWYDYKSVKMEGTCHAEKCYTASGKEIGDLERDGVLFCASNAYPFWTRLRVTNKANGKSVVVTVLDRGGFSKKYSRKIDLSRESFGKIASTAQGIAEVRIEVLTMVKTKSKITNTKRRKK